MEVYVELYLLVAQTDRFKNGGGEPRLFCMGFSTMGAPFMDMAILIIANIVDQQ